MLYGPEDRGKNSGVQNYIGNTLMATSAKYRIPLVTKYSLLRSFFYTTHGLGLPVHVPTLRTGKWDTWIDSMLYAH